MTLIGLFLIQVTLAVYGKFDVSAYLALSLNGIEQHRYWQLLTFQFLHAVPWPWHVLGNCLFLYFFGGALEEVLGPRRLLKLYFAGGFLGGGMQLLHTLLFQWLQPLSKSAGMVGASAGVSALLAAFCALYPFKEACFVVYFFPVRLKARYILWFCLAISTFGMLFPFNSVAHAAHMGGLLTGIAYARWFHESNPLAVLLGRFRARRRSSPIVKVRFPKAPSSSAGNAWEAGPAPRSAAEDGDFMSKEVDPILDKIRAHGIHSLTDRERAILEQARSRMGR